MGTCCSVTTPQPVQRTSSASTVQRVKSRKLVATDSLGRRQSSASRQRNSTGQQEVDGGQNRNTSRSTGAATSVSGLLQNDAMLSGNPQIVASMESGAPCGESAVSVPSPLTQRNLELHVSSVGAPCDPNLCDRFMAFAECDDEPPVASRGDRNTPAAGDHRSVDHGQGSNALTRRSCPSSVVSAHQVNPLFGSGWVDGDAVECEEGEMLPAFQPLQMPTHLWPPSNNE